MFFSKNVNSRSY